MLEEFSPLRSTLLFSFSVKTIYTCAWANLKPFDRSQEPQIRLDGIFDAQRVFRPRDGQSGEDGRDGEEERGVGELFAQADAAAEAEGERVRVGLRGGPEEAIGVEGGGFGEDGGIVVEEPARVG